MATENINDWAIKVGFDDSDVVKGARRVEKIMARLAKTQSKLDLGSSGTRSRSGTGGGVRKPQGFQLADDRQLKIANTIDSVVRRAGRQLDKNSKEFKTINREATKLRGSIAGVSSKVGLERLNNNIRVLRDNLTHASTASRKMARDMDMQKFAANGLNDSMKHLIKSYVSIFAIIQGGRAFFRAGTEIESLKATFLAASGSVEEAAQNFEFVKKSADEIGISLTAAGKGYAKLAASAKGAGLNAEETNEIFLAAAESSRTFGLNADRTNLVFLAFSQILSKGKVSQEELRRQLGEQLPGVMTTAAKAMGVTTDQLEKMIQAGIPAVDFIGKFSKQLRMQVRENGALEAAQQKVLANVDRFHNSLVLLSDQLFNAGGAGTGFNNILNGLVNVVHAITPVIINFAAGVGQLFNAIGVILTPITYLISLLGEGTGLTLVLSVVTAATLQWAASMLFGKAAMDALTLSSMVNFIKSLSLTAIGTSIAQKGFLGWAASIWTTVGALRALKLALGPIGLAFLALEGVGALASPSIPSPKAQQQTGTTINNNTIGNVDMTINEAADPRAVQEQASQGLIDSLAGNTALIRG